MANKAMKARIVHKHDIEANWMQATGFSPLKGEIVVYDAEAEGDSLPEGRTTRYEYARFKIGDGNTNINDLVFCTEEEIKKLKQELQNENDIRYVQQHKSIITDDYRTPFVSINQTLDNALGGNAKIELQATNLNGATKEDGISTLTLDTSSGINISTKYYYNTMGDSYDSSINLKQNSISVKTDSFMLNNKHIACIDDIQTILYASTEEVDTLFTATHN